MPLKLVALAMTLELYLSLAISPMYYKLSR